jgi:hypothetical protein
VVCHLPIILEKTCQELQLNDVRRLIITEDNSRAIEDVEVINIKERLIGA